MKKRFGSNLTYTKNQLVSLPNYKTNHRKADAISLFSIVSKGKTYIMNCIFLKFKTFHASYEHACLKGKYQLSSSTNNAIILWSMVFNAEISIGTPA